MSPRMVVAVVVVGALVGCSGEPPNTPAPGELLASTKLRVTDPAPQADVDRTVDSATTFGFDVYRRLPASGNAAFSPYSVMVALSMTYPGARGDTQAAFEQVLHLQLPAAQHHRAMNTLDAALQSRGQGQAGKDGRPFRLRTNNQLFGQTGQHFEGPFLDVLAEEYGAGMRLLDFRGASEPSRRQINAWISTNTERLIPELLPQGSITPDTVLTLVNTLYFNAAWKTKFDHALTHDLPFTLSDGAQVQAPTMSKEDVPLRYALVDGVDVIELPYAADEVVLTLLVPPVGRLGELEQSLDGPRVRAMVAALAERTVGVQLPRFSARSQVDLKGVLSALGLGVAFTSQADLSGLTGERDLVISGVVHEAVVRTAEDGTEAAAATAVVIGRVSLPEYLKVNRPFVYLIRDRATGAVLFIGRIVNPVGEEQ